MNEGHISEVVQMSVVPPVVQSDESVIIHTVYLILCHYANRINV